MATARDQAFAQAVIRGRLVSREKLQECLEEVDHAESAGVAVTLESVMVNKGLLSRQEAKAVLGDLTGKRAPETIGGFEVLQTVRHENGHTTYKARQLSDGRVVALTVFADPVEKNGYLEQILHGTRAVCGFRHPNIVESIDVGEESGRCYIATELVDGEPLDEKLRREGAIGEAEALNIAEQVCLALAYIHATANMTHGGVRPGNIMLTKSGAVKLAGLGLAGGDCDSVAVSATSAFYISPEQACESPNVGIRSDIYSLGATLFHMITGAPPYSGIDAKAIIAKHVAAPVPVARAPGANLSEGTRTLIATMLAKYPRDRHQAPDKLLENIRQVRARVMRRVAAVRPAKTVGEPLALPQASSKLRAVCYFAAGVLLIALASVAVVITSRNNDSAVELTGEATPPAVEETQGHVADVPPKIVTKTETEKRATNALRKKLASATFEKLKKRADGHATQERYSLAIAAWRQYPALLAFDEWGPAVAREKRTLEQKARDREKELIEKAQKLAKEKRFNDAIQVLAPGRKFGLSHVTRRIDRQIAKYEEARREALRERSEQAKRTLTELVAGVVQREQYQQYDGALKACDAFLAGYKAEPTQEEAGWLADVGELKSEILAARDTWREIMASPRNTPGKGIQVRSLKSGITLKGVVCDVTNSTLTIKVNDNKITQQLSDIDLKNILELAGVAGWDEKSIVRKARFFLAAGDIENAQQVVGMLASNVLKNKWQAWIARRGVLAGLGRMAGATREGDWKKALAAILTCRRAYKGSKAFNAAKEEIDSYQIKVEEGLGRQLRIRFRAGGQFIELLEELRDVEKWHNEHRAPTKIKCDRCKGAGYLVQREWCTYCNGQRGHLCRACRGIGHTHGVRCAKCGGTGKVVCRQCGGKGRIRTKEKCARCNGSGKVKNPHVYTKPMPREYQKALFVLRSRYGLTLKAVAELLDE